MERLKKIAGDAVFVIQILIIFVLVFEDRIVVPAILQSFGRMHPLLLHLPIGLLLVTVVLVFTSKHFEEKAASLLTDLLLHFTALTASLTTLMGLFLSLEGSFGAEQIQLHKWLGVALSFLCWGLLVLRTRPQILRPVSVAGVVLLVLTGHYGANLTHGEDFVWAPLQAREERVARVITDSTTLFAATVEPIFEAKCYSCHNPKKAKGNLVLTSMEGIMKGGESGPLWHPADADQSLLVERLMLPLDHDDHMPPKDKAQLTPDEINFIALWIDEGADLKRKLKEVSREDTLGKLASMIVPRYQQTGADQPKYTFRFASPQKIMELSRPNRTVFQIAMNEPAVHADFFLRESYDPKHIEELLAVKEQLVSLNLSNMPVKDSDVGIISKFENLETLNLNNTGVTGKAVSQLAPLKKLKSVSLSGTAIDTEALKALATNPSVKEVFFWNTKISSSEAEALRKEFPNIHWDMGFVPDTSELLKLNPPMLKNKSAVLERNDILFLRHNLPGTQLRYTLDGSEPDSVNSPIFEQGLTFDNYLTVKARAFKDGWLSSEVAEFFVFKKGYQPDTAFLETKPDERYMGEGPMTLLDGKQGLPDFYRHPAWMAFRENDLVLNFAFTKEVPTIKNITLSFAHNNWSICMPPDEMQLWGGDDADNLKLITKLDPPEVPKPGKARIEGFSMDVPPSNFRYYKLVARPTRKLADGNPKNRTLWLMVDEVFIN
mgnify:CR=1 FL=1